MAVVALLVAWPIASQASHVVVPGGWHYCASANGYYPNVPSCAEPWILVPPRS